MGWSFSQFDWERRSLGLGRRISSRKISWDSVSFLFLMCQSLVDLQKIRGDDGGDGNGAAVEGAEVKLSRASLRLWNC